VRTLSLTERGCATRGAGENFNKSKYVEVTGIVKSIERDPNRSALIALIYWSNSIIGSINNNSDLWSEYSYILAPVGLNLGDSITSIRKLSPVLSVVGVSPIQPHVGDPGSVDPNGNFHFSSASRAGGSRTSVVKKLVPPSGEGNLIPIVGNFYLLKDLAVGTVVHNLAGKYIRAAGCSGIIISKTELKNGDSEIIVSLQSGQYKAFTGNTIASIGSLSNPEHKSYKYKKAGQKAWLGRRPIVRGVAMNPIDHPHGGGEGKSSGGRPSVTPWGKPTKGKPTRSKAKPSLRISHR